MSKDSGRGVTGRLDLAQSLGVLVWDELIVEFDRLQVIDEVVTSGVKAHGGFVAFIGLGGVDRGRCEPGWRLFGQATSQGATARRRRLCRRRGGFAQGSIFRRR